MQYGQNILQGLLMENIVLDNQTILKLVQSRD